MFTAKANQDGKLIFPKKQLFVQFHFVDLCTDFRVLFFKENWIFNVKTVCVWIKDMKKNKRQAITFFCLFD